MPKQPNYYEDDMDSAPAATADEEMPGDEKGAPDDSESAQEVVNVSFLQGAKPGDHCEVKVTKIDGDSALITFVKPIGGDEEGAGDETSGPEEEGEMAMAGEKSNSYYD